MARVVLFVIAAVVALPAVALGQDRGHRNKDIFVNGHDARDGRYDGRGPRRDDDYQRGRRNGDYDRDGDVDQYDREAWRRERERRRDDRYNDGRYNDGRYDDRYGNNGRYGNYGYNELRQTALNAGYNEGIKEGRRDGERGERFEYRDESAYQKATKDYSSRLGDRGLYQQYFRQGFANGYEDGYRQYSRNGYDPYYGRNNRRTTAGDILGGIFGRP